MANGLKYFMTDVRPSIAGVLTCIALLSITACTTAGLSSQAEVSSASPTNAETTKNLSPFDNIVTLEVVFPDPAVRAIYRELPLLTFGEWQVYRFELIQQPHMDPARDAHDISISIWKPTKTFFAKKNHYDYAKGITGRREERTRFVTSTTDGVYAISILSDIWLPDTVDVAEFDPESVAGRLLLNYSRNSNKQQTKSRTGVSSAPIASVEAAKDLFDSIVTPEIVFPDPVARALYEESPPGTSEKGWRSYSFALIRQPSMDRHDFNIISVTWAPAGTFHQGTGGTGGPGGGFVDFVTRTPDGIYDLRITLGMQLPAVIDVPEFDLSSSAERLLLHYSRNLSEQQTKPLGDK